MRLCDVKMGLTAYTTFAKDVYGDANPEAPEGYEFTGEFRPPRSEDIILSLNGGHAVRIGSWSESEHRAAAPRLILRRIPRKRVIFEQTGETRAPKKDEYVPEGSGFHQATRDWFPEFVRPIYTRREEEF